ncbi:MAG: ADP-ribosylglycohydrolase family protein [Treponema sp.]|nr:ADP-ribosylglycohydrolase family protein [Treponema sp.]
MATLRDAVYGVAVGDALGSPVQFRERGSFPPVSEMLYCRTFSFEKEPGTWTDDTSMTLALCDSIRELGRVDVQDIRGKFTQWLLAGRYTQDGRAFDVGNTCYRAIKEGKGRDDYHSNGNGSLMRIIPMAFVEGADDGMIDAVSAITHAHAISCEACRIYIHIARSLLKGKSMQDAVRENTTGVSKVFAPLASLQERTRDSIRSSGFVVDTLEAALWCLLTTGDFRGAVEKAVNLGGDADTVGAVAGGLAGIMYGYSSIPESWISALRKKEMLEACLF